MGPETRLAGSRRGGGPSPRSRGAEGGLLKLPWKRFLVPVAASLLAIPSVGCAAVNHLADYGFADHGLAVVTVAPRRPELFLGGVAARSGNPLAPNINRSAAARQIGIGRARARLDSAAARVPVSNRMNGQLLKRASAALGAHAIQVRDRADYVLLVHVRRLRIDARRGNQAWLDFGAAVSLIDQGTEHRIWHAKVTAREPLTESVRPDGRTASGAMTAGALYTLSGEEFEGVLEDVAARTAQAVVDRLRSDLREAREDRPSSG